MEVWVSGWNQQFAKLPYGLPYRGFESPSFRSTNFAKWRFRLAARTHASHAWNTGSIPVGATKRHPIGCLFFYLYIYNKKQAALHLYCLTLHNKANSMKTPDIVKQFANKHGFDIINPCAKRNGWSYFLFDFSNRPHYTGHPHIVKIDSTGKILVVTDLKEIYWATKQASTLNNNH